MKAIIPIGGRGTRMRPVTFTANKHFIPVGNKRLIYYPIETIVKAGIKELAITYNPGQLEYAKNILGDGSRWNIEITYILQEKPMGLANIVQVCEDWVGDDQFVFHCGDNIFVDGLDEAVQYFEKEKPDGLVTMLEHPENFRLGVPYFDENNRMTQYVEKPDNPPHKFAVPGVYFANANFFKAFKGKDAIKPSARGEYEIPDPFQWMIDHGYRVDVIEYKGTWLDPGKFNDWLDSNQFLLDKNTHGEQLSETADDVTIQGRVDIGKNCVIKNSKLRGPIKIGDDVVIENSFIGPYTSIYKHCNLNHCHLSNSVLMEGVTLQNIDRPIDSSILAPHVEVTRDDTNQNLEMFLGEMSKIIL